MSAYCRKCKYAVDTVSTSHIKNLIIEMESKQVEFIFIYLDGLNDVAIVMQKNAVNNLIRYMDFFYFYFLFFLQRLTAGNKLLT